MADIEWLFGPIEHVHRKDAKAQRTAAKNGLSLRYLCAFAVMLFRAIELNICYN